MPGRRKGERNKTGKVKNSSRDKEKNKRGLILGRGKRYNQIGGDPNPAIQSNFQSWGGKGETERKKKGHEITFRSQG